MRKTALLILLGLAGGVPSAACDSDSGLVSPCSENEIFQDGACVLDLEVSLNSVGYLPERRKVASFVGESPEFSVHRADDDEEVFSGTADGPLNSNDTGQDVYVADFSEIREPGSYYVRAADGESATFAIGSDALDDALRVTMLGLYGQRCGEKVEFEFEDDTFRHAACHLKEASLSLLGEQEEKDDTGGWHDAGDYGKYTRNGAFSVAMLLSAYEHFPETVGDFELNIPENDDDVPDMLNEARVELEWLMKVQYDDGSFAHKVTGKNFEGVVMPSKDTNPRFFVSTSSHSTGNAVAVLAQGARLFEQYDAEFAARLLEAAEAGQKWLDENPEEVEADQSDVSTGTYSSEGDGDERLWALVELWETTGSEDYLAKVEERVPNFGYRSSFDWPDVQALALVTYALSEREGRDPVLIREVREDIVSSATGLANSAGTDPYGRGFESYYWGTNGIVARMTFSMAAAHKLQPDTNLLDGITAQVDHLLGRNAVGRSFVTDLGEASVQAPHHRPSEADAVSDPWPGLLVGGPHGGDLPALNYTDTYSNFEHNEVAINWSTAMAYALVAAIATQEDQGCGDMCSLGGAPGTVVDMGGMGGTQ